MPQSSAALDALPAAAARSLRKLGSDLAVARKRRKQSLRDWAQRLSVSVPTLMRMEKGDPSVSMAVYASALWLVNRHVALGDLADPAQDLAALEAELAKARSRHQRVEPPRG